MPRIPGERGPAPRREAETRRTNNKGTATPLSREMLQELPFEVNLEPSPRPAPKHWDEAIQEFWEALQVDPARKWMTAADWSLTKLVLESLNQSMTATDKEGNIIGVTANHLTAVLKHAASIGITEQARLRLGKEVTLFPAKSRGSDDGEVVDIRNARRGEVQ